MATAELFSAQQNESRPKDLAVQDQSTLAKEPAPGMVNTAQKIESLSELEPGDHIVYRVIDLPHRPVFRSAMFLNKSTPDQGYVSLLTNSEKGVTVETMLCNSLFRKSPYKIIYDPACRYSNDEAIERARRREAMNEKSFHPLYNNSHFFVTLAKTGKEYPLTDIIVNLVKQCEGVYKDSDAEKLKPVLKKVPLQSIMQVQPGDHIVHSSKHWLVADTDCQSKSFQAYSYKNAVIFKQLQWSEDTYQLEYQDVALNSKPVEAAQKEYQKHRTSQKSDSQERMSQKSDCQERTLQESDCQERTSQKSDCQERTLQESDCQEKREWASSEEFVTTMKCGSGYLFNDSCLISSENVQPVSCTHITPDVSIDEGDHLVVKDEDGTYRSILVFRCIGRNAVLAITGFDPNQKYQQISVFENEVHRVNYKQHFPNQEVLERANSTQGLQLLQRSLHDMSLFVTWAKTGTSTSLQSSINDLVQQQQIKQIQPLFYTKIISLDEVQVGDHLFQPYKSYRWHFMVTEKNVDSSDPTKMRTIYYLRGRVLETIEKVDISKMPIYRIEYPEQLPDHEAIQRIRSKLGKQPISAWERMKLVLRAKTGSEQGMEVDLMVNNSMPVSKSRIWTFSQLEVGDHLVHDPGRMSMYCHYLVKSIESPTSCTVISSEYWTVKETTLTINVIPDVHDQHEKQAHFYRIDYNSDACIAATSSLRMAENYMSCRRKWTGKGASFVYYLKTTDVENIEVNSLQDDRILLRREKVTSVKELMPGDHVECELEGGAYKLFRKADVIDKKYHHMFVKDTDIQADTFGTIDFHNIVGDAKKSLALTMFHLKDRKLAVVEHDKKVSECGQLSRIVYLDRIHPDEGLAVIQAKVGEKGYNLKKNNCEHLVTLATVGHKVSIQVNETVRSALYIRGYAADSFISNTHDSIARAGLKSAAKVTVKGITRSAVALSPSTAQASTVTTEAAALASFRIGYSAALNGTAIGVVSGVAAGVSIMFEAPYLTRSIYKLHRKNKFSMLSDNDYKREVIKESFTSANTVIGGTAGAIVGQVAIPVPVLGAAVGGFLGTLVGRAAGYGEGWLASKLVSDKTSTLSMVITCDYFQI